MPLAMADIYAAVICLIRMWAANASEIKVPTRSQTLAAWFLPMMSRSLKADEDEREAFEMLKAVERLKAESVRGDRQTQ